MPNGCQEGSFLLELVGCKNNDAKDCSNQEVSHLKNVSTFDSSCLLLVLLTLLISTPYLAGCGSGSSSPAASYGNQGGGTSTSTLKGIILSQTGAPIEGVEVMVESLKTTTDVDGQYQILDLKPGSYLLKAEKPGFQDYTDTVVLAGNEVTFKDITMTTDTPRGTVIGQVTDGSSGKPIENVIIAAGATNTKTGIGGYYILAGVTTGTVTITARKTGYEQYTGSVTVTPDSVTPCSFDMKASPTSGSVEGTVTDQDSGAALQGATVTIGQSSATTDVNGFYSITGLEAGQQIAEVTRTGYRPKSAVVTVKAGESVICDIMMVPDAKSGGVAGLVTDRDSGKDLEDVIVSIASLKTSTNESGFYMLTGIKPDTYIITAQKTGYENYSGTVEVRGGEVTNCPIEMVPEESTGWVHGYVTSESSGAPVSGAQVIIGDHNVESEEDGYYELLGIPVGDRDIAVLAAGYEEYRGTVTVEAGSQGTSFNVELTPKPETATVFGQVTDAESGEPIADVNVSIGASHCLTREDGNYTLATVPVGSRVISAVKNGYGYVPESITVTSPTTEKNIQMTPSPTTGEVRGTVTDSWKKGAIPRAIIIAGFKVTRSDRDGRYRIKGLPPGRTNIYAVKHAYFIYSGEVEIKAGETTRHNISMTPLTLKGTVEGRVTDKNTGARMEGALVFIGVTSIRTDAEGNYQLDVIAGPRLIFALKHGYYPQVDLIWVTAAETLIHNIRMEPLWDTGQVSGTVTDADSGRVLENVEVTIGASRVLTNRRGYFELDGVREGSRTIIAMKADYTGYAGSVTVQGGGATSYNFSMTPAAPTGNVTGKVTDSATGNPVEDALVYIGATESRTISSGRYILTGIATGSRTITVEKTGYDTLIDSVDVTAGTTTFHVLLAPVPSSGAIRGTVTDAITGNPVRDAVVKAQDAETATGDGGEYELTGLEEGDCEVTVSKPGYTDSAATISVKNGETVIQNLALSPIQEDSTLEGYVTDSALGRPLQGVQVTSQGPGGGSAITDSTGFYRITGLEAGNHTVIACLPGYTDYSGNVDIIPGSTVAYSFKMTAQGNRGSISGTVTDSSTNLPVAGARITFADREGESDAAGRYEILNVMPGNRDFSAIRDGYGDVNEKVQVKAGESVIHDVPMTPSL